MTYRDPPEPEEDAFVEVARPTSALEGEMAVDFLRQQGIVARLLGTRDAALIGVGPQIVALRLEAPASRAREARGLLAALARGELVDEEGAPESVEGDRAPAHPTADDHHDEGGERPRQAVLAIGSVMLFFGGSHLYAQRPWTAAVLAATQLGALLQRGDAWPASEIASATMATVLALDLVFGLVAVRAWNRGVRRTIARQVIDGLVLAAVAIGVGVAAALARAA